MDCEVMDMNRTIFKLVFALLLVIMGSVLLFIVDWKIFVGVFLFIWGDNLAKSEK